MQYFLQGSLVLSASCSDMRYSVCVFAAAELALRYTVIQLLSAKGAVEALALALHGERPYGDQNEESAR